MWKKSVGSSMPCAMRRFFAAMFVAGLLAGCVTLVDKPADIAWHTCYQPIGSAEAHDFLQRGIILLLQNYGDPDIPIKQVLLRQSVKTAAAAGYDIAKNFSLNETVDAERGLFCIYIGVPPEHERFYYLLGHEIGHLLHPTRVDTASEERFCNEFSRQLCEQESRPFNAQWETRKWVCE